MIPDILVWVLAVAAAAYTVHMVIDLLLMLREYQQSKKEDPKEQGLSAYIR